VRLVFATEDLVRAGRSFKGFPLLLSNDCWPLEPAQTFLWETLAGTGAVSSKLTWEHYGRWLYDFFAFLNANGLQWNEPVQPTGLGVVARYRDWSLGQLRLKPSTVNLRLSLVVRFYEWAKKNGHVDQVPYAYREVHRGRAYGFLAHTADSNAVLTKPDVKVREHQAPPKFLTDDQVRVCREARLSDSQRLLFDMMVRVGLRSCEARTIPLKYVFNPRLRKDLKPGQMLRVDLSPADMELKYSKPRSVDIPWTLMEDMNAYAVHRRQGLKRGELADTGVLILNELGNPYSRTGVVAVMKSIVRQVGFHVRAHMLRHTYGTYTLRALRSSRSFAGEPLLYVRDRMGHSNVQTTAIYLHLINQLEAQLVLAHEDHIDQLFAKAEDKN
jgi:site-specific recombinase XerD